LATKLMHLTVRSDGSQAILGEVDARLEAVRRVTAHLGCSTLFFSVADTHWHSLNAVPVDRLGVVRRDLEAVFRHLDQGSFERPHFKPVENIGHLLSCFNYVLGNREKHDLPGDPHADPGSCAPDLLGARILPGFDPQAWRAHLPRFEPRDLFSRVGLRPVEQASNDVIRERGAVRLVEAAAAAVARPALRGNTPEVVAARVAVVRIGLNAGFAPSELAYALEVRRQGIPERRHLEAPELEVVVRKRVSFDLQLEGRKRAEPRRGSR
jgi:hypothetical protein